MRSFFDLYLEDNPLISITMYETRDTALDFSYKVNPAGWSTLKNALDVSSAWPACVDCVEQSYPSSEITSQCTDKCVVIACDDPGHSDISCHGARGDPHCDLICDGTMNCTNCTGFDEFVSTLLMRIPFDFC